MVVERAGTATGNTSTLDESLGDRLAKIKGVAKVSKTLQDSMPIDGRQTPTQVNGWSADSPAFDALTISAGREFSQTKKT